MINFYFQFGICMYRFYSGTVRYNRELKGSFEGEDLLVNDPLVKGPPPSSFFGETPVSRTFPLPSYSWNQTPK